MLIKTIPVGHLETNCYIVANENTLECIVIDPGAEGNTILDYIEDNKLQIKSIYLTHGHFDHTGAVQELTEETGCPVYISPLDVAAGDQPGAKSFAYPWNPDKSIDLRYLYDGDIIEDIGLTFEIIATPGHTPGSITIKVEDVLFTGDTLFRGSMGRTDFEYGSADDEIISLKKLCDLNGDFEVYPGHMEYTSLDRERALNYYCRQAQRNG